MTNVATSDSGLETGLAASGTAGGGFLASAFGVRPQELRPTRAMAIAAFLLGLAVVMFYSGSNAIFLSTNDIDTLPLVYIANGLLMVVAGLLYSLLSRRVGVQAVMVSFAGLSALVVFGLWVWSLASDDRSVGFAMATSYRLLFMFSLLGLWEVASTLFDIRQAKRLFPVVAVGMMLAFVFGGALAAPVSALIGANNLILVSAVFFAVHALWFAALVRTELGHLPVDNTPPAGPRDIIADPFSRLLALMRTVVILLTFVAEFAFYEQAAATFDSTESLAGFFGLFIGVSTVLMAAVTGLISARYIAHYGVKVGILTMPAGVAAVALVAALWGTFIGVNTGFFVLVAAGMTFNLVLANAIEAPVGALMFQPLPPERRMPVRVAVDGWLGSLALVLTGGLLLLVDAANFDSVVPVMWLLVLIGVAGVGLGARQFAGYREALRNATTRAFGGDGGAANLVGGNRAFSSAVGLSAGAAVALGEVPGTSTLTLLEHPDATIAGVGLEVLAASTTANDGAPKEAVSDAVHSLTYRPGASSELRATAVTALARLDPPRAVEIDASRDEPQVYAALLAARLDAGAKEAAEELAGLVESPNPADRLLAAATIARISNDPPLDAAQELLADDDPAVQTAMLEAFERGAPTPLAGQLLEAGLQPANRRHAVRALAHSSREAFQTVVDGVDALPEDYQADLVATVYPKHTRRPALLHEFVAPGQPSRLRRSGFAAISATEVAPPATVGRMLRDDMELATTLISAARDLGDQHPALRHAIASEFALVRSAIYVGLSIDHPIDRVSDIEALASCDRDDDRANAIEALDVMLSPELRRGLIPLLEPVNIEDATSEVTSLDDQQSPQQWLEVLAVDPRLDKWTRRTAAHFSQDGKKDVGDPGGSNERQIMSDLIERVIALKGVDIFSTLPYPLLVELAELVREVSWEPGQVVITEGDLDQDLYALTAGEVLVTSSTAADVTLSAGTVFGELALLSPAPRSATVAATTSGTALVVGRETLLTLADRRPEVMVEIAAVLANRLRSPSVSGSGVQATTQTSAAQPG